MGEVKAINNIHRILLGAAFTGGALFAVSLTTDGAAHADDKPAAVAEQPGGLLDAVTGTVDQVTPDEPKPEPADEPAIDLPPVEVPVNPPPLVIVTLPVLAPTPTPTPAPEQPTVQLPVQADEPADEVEATLPAGPVVAPIELPVLIGPLPGRTLDDGIRPAEPAALPEPPICDDRIDDPAQPRSDGKEHRRIHTTPDRAAGQPRPGRPCPNTPSNPSQANTTPSVKPPPPTGEQLVAISAAGAYSRPVLHRLTQMRPRSHMPAGRTEHPEPGPA